MRTPKRSKRARDDADATPYERYADHADRLTDRVHKAWDASDIRRLPTWDKGRGPQSLTIDDLAIGLWAVECVGKQGLSYGQLARCFKVCRGVSCHRNKASAILAALQSFGLITKIGNYSVGRKGNVYAVVGMNDSPMPPPIAKRPQRPQQAPPINPSADDMADPW